MTFVISRKYFFCTLEQNVFIYLLILCIEACKELVSLLMGNKSEKHTVVDARSDLRLLLHIPHQKLINTQRRYTRLIPPCAYLTDKLG
jgi:hypothetical protein